MEKINNFEEFKAAVKSVLERELPECRMELMGVPKNNGVCLSGIAAYPNNTSVSPTVYLEPYYDELQSGKPFDEISTEIIQRLEDGMERAENINAKAITDFEAAKERICYRLINKSANVELLKTIPHRDFYDLAIVYYIMLKVTDEGVSSMKISNDMVRHWGIDEQRLYSLACKNTPILNRGKVMPMGAVMGSLAGKTATVRQGVERITADGFDIVYDGKSEMTIYIATNANGVNGAAVILYYGFLETIAQKLGSFFFIPSSVHEYLIIPNGLVNGKEILAMVREVNETAVSAEEVLSDNCYYYDAPSNTLKMIS